MDTIEKGFVGETKVAIRAAQKGWKVSRPLTEARYDLVIDDGNCLLRAQVKYVDYVTQTGAFEVNLMSECRNSGYRKCYDASEVDVVIAYIAPLDEVCWIGTDDFHGRSTISLRDSPARNGQTKGVWMIEDFVW